MGLLTRRWRVVASPPRMVSVLSQSALVDARTGGDALMKPPVIEKAPLAAVDLMRNMTEAGWNPQIGYSANPSYEYWQVVGTWGDVRVEGWWRRPRTIPQQSMWRPLMLAKIRGEAHDVKDFRALEPADEGADRQVGTKMSQIHVIASVLSPAQFVEQILGDEAKSLAVQGR